MEYTLAIRDVHYQKGSLLDYNEIFLAEGPWPGKAYLDACRRDQLRSPPICLSDYRLSRGPLVSQGPYAQDTMSPSPDPISPGSATPGREDGVAPPAARVPAETRPSNSTPPATSAATSWSHPRRLPQAPDESPQYEVVRTSCPVP